MPAFVRRARTRRIVRPSARASLDFRRPSLHRPENRTDHLQAVASALVASQHQGSGLQCLFDHRDLALVQLEVRSSYLGKISPRLSAVMQARVTSATERDEVLFGIVTGMAPEFCVVNFKVGHLAACLAFPAIPSEHLVAKPLVWLRMKP
jgi:hypothetical protein